MLVAVSGMSPMVGPPAVPRAGVAAAGPDVLLARIRDLGLCLISVRRLPASEAGNQAQPSDPGPPGDG